ncbi:SufD family Fe-S cluster assembly protein [Candidatus Gottesmanbacteria bacterium]|nr:SufD family Fe-S cluster assembly protein [Candidatus Gottesmanbacteria bacterium]
MKSFIIHKTKKKKESLEYILKKNSQLTLVLVVSKAINTDIHVVVRLTGRGATANVIGLVVGRGDNNITMHTEQVHEAQETTSNLLVKAALFDEAEFAYDGIIRIEKNAQKSDAYQKNENLLLSGDAHVRSDPALEILANDVRCTHGSTTGKPDEDQLWYLQSRGITRHAATQLLIEGFLERAISTVSDTINQEKIRKLLW